MKQSKAAPNTVKKESKRMFREKVENTSKLLSRGNDVIATGSRHQSARKRDSIIYTAGAASTTNKKKRNQMSRHKIVITSPVLDKETNNALEILNNVQLPQIKSTSSSKQARQSFD